MKLPSRVLSVAALAIALVAPSPAVAGAPTEQLRRHVDAVLQTLSSPELKKEGRAEARRAEIRKIALRIFDFEETARRSLGRHWQSRTPTERQEFVKLFTDLLEHSYVSKIDQYGGEKILYTGDTMESDQATVKTKIQTPKGAEIPIEYRMHKGKDQWLVYDVVIEGVSLVGNYRTQFNKIIQTSSYEDLIQKIKTRAIGAPAATTPRG
ncbi:MAG: ABC transporter substrate-binding protein [Candidatus Rokubacteria bacterium]|nr:ABC transporter substrate-binding protein [Candidatus Rokubacteria bacterium]